jgi:hypothetical protein
MKRNITLLTLILLLAACSGSVAAGDPAPVVERYFQAKVAGDAETIRQLLCSEMEQEFERQMHSFDSVSQVSIQGLSCQRRGSSSVVDCQGKIVALYGAEQTEFPLGAYRIVLEDGQWKWCGETE